MNKEIEKKKQNYLSKVYLLLATSFIPTIIGVLIGVPALNNHPEILENMLCLLIGYVLISFILIFLMSKFKDNHLGYVFLLTFTLLSGLSISPIIEHYTKIQNGESIVMQTALMTFILFVGMSFLSKFVKDSNKLGEFLFIGLIVIIISGTLLLFFHSTILILIYSSLSAILFSAYIMYDTKKLTENINESPIIPILGLYRDYILTLLIYFLAF